MVSIIQAMKMTEVKNWDLVRTDHQGENKVVLRTFLTQDRASQEAMMLSRRFHHFRYYVEPKTA